MTQINEKISIKTLTFKDAKQIWQLEQKLFPKNQQNGLEKLEQMLLNNERYGSEKLVFGLFEQTNLVGYAFHYPKGFISNDKSMFRKIVYAGDIAVIPEFRKYANMLLGEFLTRCKIRYPSRPIHAHAFEYYKDKWIKRQGYYNDHGYKLGRYSIDKNMQFSEDVYLLEWWPIDRPLYSEREKNTILFRPQLKYIFYRIRSILRKRKKP